MKHNAVFKIYPKLIYLLVSLICSSHFIISCKEDSSNFFNLDPQRIQVFNVNEIDPQPIFIVEGSSDSSYVLSKEGINLKHWKFEYKTGNDVQINNDGTLIGIFKPDEVPEISFGGYGGIIQKLSAEGDLLWEYSLFNENEILHHDVEQLSDGNVLALVWEKISSENAKNLGVDTDVDIFFEKIIEINPSNNQIVWEWKSIQHIIQNYDSSKPNFGLPINNPSKIDINYVDANSMAGDIMHANGIDYDEDRNIIFLSVNFYNEVWVIDHSTSIQESKNSFGGNYGMGGDLIYRFGNPSAYGGSGRQLFHRNHFPNLIEDNVRGKGNMLIFNNGINEKISSIYEIELPSTFGINSNNFMEPKIVWEYKNDSIFSKILCGAIRLKNGNTLITEADFGLWEVNKNKDVVWKFNAQNDSILDRTNIWRAYKY